MRFFCLEWSVLAICESVRAVRKCCKHNADGRRRERLCDVLRPFEHNKIPRILQELVEAERREIATLLETIRINVYEPAPGRESPASPSPRPRRHEFTH